MESDPVRFVGIAVVVALLGHPFPAHAQATIFTQSGNYYLPGCQALVADGAKDEGLALDFRAGQCLGAVTVLQTWLKGVRATCMPPTATVRQIIRVVVKYMQDHPERLHEDVLNLAGPAIHKAWPCPNQQESK